MANNLESMQGMFANLNNVLTTIGNQIEDDKVEKERRKIAKRFENPEKTFFNEDGTPRSPFEIQAEYQSGIMGMLQTLTGRETDNKTMSMISQLQSQFGLGVEQINKREQNKITAKGIQILNPKAIPVVEGRDMDWGTVPPELANEREVKRGFNVKEFKPFLATEKDLEEYPNHGLVLGQWYNPTYHYDRYSTDGIEKVEFRLTHPPNERYSFNKNSTYTTINNISPNWQLLEEEKEDGSIGYLKYNTKTGQYQELDRDELKKLERIGTDSEDEGLSPDEQEYKDTKIKTGTTDSFYKQIALETGLRERFIPTQIGEWKSMYTRGLRTETMLRNDDSWNKLSPSVRQKLKSKW